jgi:Na+/H+-dicarboxylate symporter
MDGITQNWIAPFGDIFINLLKLIALPLVLFSIIKGIADLKDIRRLGRLGIRTLILYLLTTVMAVWIGLLLVNLLGPGKTMDQEMRIKNRIAYELWAHETEGVEVLDGLSFTADPAYAGYLAQGQAALESLKENDPVVGQRETVNDRSHASPLQFLLDMVPSNIFLALSSNGLMLQIIFFALFFGIVLLLISPGQAAPVLLLVDGLNAVFLKMVDVVMLGAPFFVFALMAATLGKMAGGNLAHLGEVLYSLTSYALVVVLGLALQVFGVYAMLVKWMAKGLTLKRFYKGMQKAQVLAFSTSSSAATLPVTMQCVEHELKVPPRIGSFVLPIGATVNMDGTSLYIAVAVVYLAQIHLIQLDLLQQLTIVLTATLASIGASAVPSAGLIMMIMVLQSVGLNPLWISIILPVDRILDMCRTVVNVTGDAAVAGVMASLDHELPQE